MSDLEFLGFAETTSSLDPVMYQYFKNLPLGLNFFFVQNLRLMKSR